MGVNKPWTDEKNERLKTFVARGVSIIRAAAAFNRTTTGIRAQARKLGTPYPPRRMLPRQWADTLRSGGKAASANRFSTY
jgi:hypothetical protein